VGEVHFQQLEKLALNFYTKIQKPIDKQDIQLYYMDNIQLYVLRYTILNKQKGENMNKKISRLPDAEIEIMKVIWSNQTPISTVEIKEVLDRKKTWNLSAIQTLLLRLVERNFLTTEKIGKSRYYNPIISEEEYLAVENKSFLEKLNDNSIKKFVLSLCNSNSITEEELFEIKKIIENKIKEI